MGSIVDLDEICYIKKVQFPSKTNDNLVIKNFSHMNVNPGQFSRLIIH